MYSRCSNHECEAAYELTAEVLRDSMGMVRCVRCRTVFNALSNIVDVPPCAPVIKLGYQLPLVQTLGDRDVADPALLRSLPRRDAIGVSPHAGSPQSSVEVVPMLTAATVTQSMPGVERMHRAVDPERTRQMEEIERLPWSPVPPSAKGTSTARSMVWHDLLPTVADLHHALRNLLRHRRRTFMGLLAIAAGVMAMLVAGGFIEWIKWTMREGTIQSHLGHVQVVARHFLEKGESDPFSYLLGSDLKALQERIATMPEVEALAPRLSFSGLASFGDVSISFLGEGVDPTQEAMVSRRLRIVDGEGLSPSQPNGIIIGKGLAENLQVKPGDMMTLLANTQDGALNGFEGKVMGIFQTSSKAFDDNSLRIPLHSAQTLLRADGAHRWVVLLRDTALTAQVVERLRSEFANDPRVEFVPWIDLADFYRKTVVLFSAQINVIWIVIALIIVVSISNTLIMNVMERTGEIGTLMALGRRRSRILALFLNEGLLLGVLGGILGALLGWIVGMIISVIGIPMPPAPGIDFSFEGEVRVTWTLALGAFALGLVATLGASVYPARKASRLEIVDALRHAR